MFSSTMSTSSRGDFNEADMRCSIAKSNSMMYSRNFDQSRPIRENNMHQNFAYACEDHFVYGVLTGFETIDAVRYCTGVLPFVLSQNIQKRSQLTLNSQQIDEFYSKLMKDAFTTVDEQFRQFKSEPLSEKAVFDIELSGNRPENYPTINDRIKELSSKLSSGLSAVVALIHDNRLFVANIGDTRAILCRKVVAENGQHCFVSVKLSTVHDLDNLNEIRRLSQLGVNTSTIRQKQEIGNMTLTRCLGNLWLKSFYKDYEDLSNATQDPILAEPDIASMALDTSCLFLILASASLIDALEEATSKKDVTEDLVKMVNDEFQQQPDRQSVAQAVVDQIRQLHYSGFDSSYGRTTCRQIEDITLLIRDLTVDAHQENNGQSTPTNLPMGKLLPQLSISVDESGSNCSGEASPSLQHTQIDNDRTITDRIANISLSENNLADDSGHTNDDEEEIDPYVDFTELLVAYNEMPEPTTANN